MKLNPFSLFKKTSKGYIGLLLRETDGIVMYLEANTESLRLEKIDSEKFTLTNRWDHLADDVDDALYKLEVRTKKTFDDIIFFVYSHLVEPETHEIKKQNLSSIKGLVKSMELRPLGFIEAYEAYIKYLFSKGENELSSIVIESDDTMLTVFTYQAGAVVSKVSAQRKKSFVSDLSETLEVVKETVALPPKIILLPSKDAQEGADLVEHNWDEKLFSTQPTISVVTEEELIGSLISTFSSQMTDVVEEVKADTAIPTEERMGFEIGGENQDSDRLIKPAFTSSLSRISQSALNQTRSILEKVSKLGIFRSRKLFIHSSIVVGVILILGSMILIELNMHKAIVTLSLPSQKLELSRSFDATSLGLKEASKSAKFEASKSATGVKNVGQPAKGTVTIYNSSLSQSKNFAKGTTLVGPGNLSFTLDTDVKLASASGDAIDIVSSSAKSAVTATAIGPESNLASGTKFSVGDEATSSVIAKADSALTGGTKTQIQVVSDKDLADAESQIIAKAKNFINNQISTELGKDAFILKPLIEVKTQSQDVNNEVGVEAGSVSVKSNVIISYSYISKEKLKLSTMKALRPKIQKDLAVSENNLKYNVQNIAVKNDQVKIEIKATARAVPPLSDEEILRSITGKTTETLKSLAKEKYHAQSVEFTVDHPVEFFKNILPLFSANIKLRLLYP